MPSEIDQSRRISKLAAAGALGLPAALVAGLIVAGFGMIVAPNMPGRADTIALGASLVGLSVLFAGVTLSICGLVAIRNSSRRLTGRGLAHFGIWLPPALVVALVGLAAWRWENASANMKNRHDAERAAQANSERLERELARAKEALAETAAREAKREAIQRREYGRLDILVNESAAMKAKHAEMKSKLEASRKLLKSADKTEVTLEELLAVIPEYPVPDELAKRVARLMMAIEQAKRATKPGTTSPKVEQLTREVEALQEQYDKKLDAFKEEARRKRRSKIEQDIIKYESYAASVQKATAELDEHIIEVLEAVLAHQDPDTLHMRSDGRHGCP